MLFGIGYDIHRLKENRRLIMGGVLFDTPYGLDGHSDADVVLHAVCDALLGAAALGDIGEYYPDTDPRWKDMSSQTMTQDILALVQRKGYSINNVDVNIIAERPRIGGRKKDIKANLARLLNVAEDRVNIKARTNEGLDSIGRGEAVSAQAVASLNEGRKEDDEILEKEGRKKYTEGES